MTLNEQIYIQRIRENSDTKKVLMVVHNLKDIKSMKALSEKIRVQKQLQFCIYHADFVSQFFFFLFLSGIQKLYTGRIS